MTASVNPKTGLKEITHPYFKVPQVQQKGIGQLRFDGQPTAVHSVPYRKGVTLDFYARLQRSDELIVTFHGANSPEKNIYPLFARIASLRKKAKAMISFSDPTLLADPERKMMLSWYLGGPGWDPLPTILRVIRKAQRKSGSKHVAFLGGSGGGFAALRASAMLPGSMAFVQDPQTNIAKYATLPVQRYFETVWRGWQHQSLLDAFPERFDMARHYRVTQPQNFVYYAQNATDRSHILKHYEPFLDACGIFGDDPVIRRRSRVFNRYDGEFSGHGKITAAEFDRFYEDALEGWRAFRA